MVDRIAPMNKTIGSTNPTNTPGSGGTQVMRDSSTAIIIIIIIIKILMSQNGQRIPMCFVSAS